MNSGFRTSALWAFFALALLVSSVSARSKPDLETGLRMGWAMSELLKGDSK
jgi:hypothetical protein